MKLIPDSNSKNNYNNLLQNIVNTLVTVAVLSVAAIIVKVAFDVVFNDLAPIRAEITEISVAPISRTPDEFCFYDVDIDPGYTYVQHDQRTVEGYATNYRDLGHTGKGIVITNEMLLAMSEEDERLKDLGYDIGGFHLYFADKETAGGNPSIVFVPIGHDFHELSPNSYGVLEVPEEVCGPCPLLCDEALGAPFYELY